MNQIKTRAWDGDQIDLAKRKDQADMVSIVKWYSPTSGFGFAAPCGGGPDILLSKHALNNFGLSSLAEGSTLKVRVVRTERSSSYGNPLPRSSFSAGEPNIASAD